MMLRGAPTIRCAELTLLISNASAAAIGGFVKALLHLVDVRSENHALHPTMPATAGTLKCSHDGAVQLKMGGGSVSCEFVSPLSREATSALTFRSRAALSFVELHDVKSASGCSSGLIVHTSRPQLHDDEEVSPRLSDKDQFFVGEISIDSPPREFVRFLESCTGLYFAEVSSVGPLLTTPTIRVSCDSKEAEVDLRKINLMGDLVGEGISTFVSRAFGNPAPLPRPQVKVPPRKAPTFGITDFVIVPTITAAPLRIWLSPHIFIATPRVSCSINNSSRPKGATQSCANILFSLVGGSLNMVTTP